MKPVDYNRKSAELLSPLVGMEPDDISDTDMQQVIILLRGKYWCREIDLIIGGVVDAIEKEFKLVADQGL